MEAPGFIHRLVSWSGTALYVASTFALVSLCWSGGGTDSDGGRLVLTDRDLGVATGGSTVDDNVSEASVDAEPLFQPTHNILHGKRWLALTISLIHNRYRYIGL